MLNKKNVYILWSMEIIFMYLLIVHTHFTPTPPPTTHT